VRFPASRKGLGLPAIAVSIWGRIENAGRVYTWVPLHLGDAANNCSPRNVPDCVENRC